MEGIPAMNKAGELVNTFFGLGGNTGHDLNFLHDILATNFTSNSFPVQNATKAQFIDGMKAFLKAFPDITVTVNNQHFEGNKVFTYGYWTATHKGEFMGMAPTGKKLKVEFMDIWTEEDGKLVRNEVVMDIAGLQQQLGDPMAAAKERNVNAVKAIYSAFEKGDIPTVLAKLSDNVVWTDAGTGVDRLYTGVRRGKPSVGDFFAALNDLVITEKFVVHDYVADGNKVVATGFYGGKVKANGKPVASDFSMVWEFDDKGMVVRHHLYLDTDNVSKALAGVNNHVATTRMAYESFLAGDVNGILQGLSDNIVWVHAGDPGKLPFAGTFKGKDQVMKFFQAIGNSVEVLKFEPYDFKQSGNAVTNKIRISGKVLKTGVVVNNMTSIKWTFDNQGKVVKWEASGDMRELEAALSMSK
jgi:ketosteroid isomerase-like protein